jgi:hypothetical protein
MIVQDFRETVLSTFPPMKAPISESQVGISSEESLTNRYSLRTKLSSHLRYLEERLARLTALPTFNDYVSQVSSERELEFSPDLINRVKRIEQRLTWLEQGSQSIIDDSLFEEIVILLGRSKHAVDALEIARYLGVPLTKLKLALEDLCVRGMVVESQPTLSVWGVRLYSLKRQ